MKWTISWNSSTQNMMQILWMLTSRCFRLDCWSPLLQNFIQSLLYLFHKYGGADVAVTNFMSKFSMLVPTKATVKLANGNTVHAQVIRIILCHFPNCSIMYPVGPVYYCPGHPSNTIPSGALKFYFGFQNVTSKHLEHCDLVDPQGHYWRSPYQTQNNLDYIQI